MIIPIGALWGSLPPVCSVVQESGKKKEITAADADKEET
jgi:hypothetical protein